MDTSYWVFMLQTNTVVGLFDRSECFPSYAADVCRRPSILLLLFFYRTANLTDH